MEFSREEFIEFKNWLNFDWETVTWSGKYADSFAKFWETFFSSSLTLNQVIRRFEFLRSQITTGPLNSWVNWLKGRFLCYVFVRRNVTLLELSDRSGVDISELSYILREFFIELFPYRDEAFNRFFQIGNYDSEYLHLTYQELADEVVIDDIPFGTSDDDIMSGLEVILYPEWEKLLKIISKEFVLNKVDLTELKERTTLQKQFKFIQDIVVLLIIAMGLIYSLKYLNTMYEKSLAEKISIFEPTFDWLDREKMYKVTKNIVRQQFNPEETTGQKLKKQADWVEEFRPEERFETESDVTLTSLSDLPKDFDYAGLELSEYEEIKKGGYRGSRYSRFKAYRILLKSIDIKNSRDKIKDVLSSYEVKQVDHVKPGTQVPGGIYYNLYVPSTELAGFLEKVSEVEDSTIYESSSRVRNLAGHNKVFIWIKNI